MATRHPVCQPLYRLAQRIDWTQFESGFAKLYKEPALPIRRMVDLLLLKQRHNLSDKRVVEQWTLNPYCQFFCGEREFQWSAPCAPGAGEPETPAPTLLHARQQAVLSLATPRAPPRVTTLTADEIDRALTWQHTMLDWNATPLAEVVAEFNRWNAVQLQLADPSLADLRVSATFRSDNVSGFLGLLQEGFKVPRCFQWVKSLPPLQSRKVLTTDGFING